MKSIRITEKLKSEIRRYFIDKIEANLNFYTDKDSYLNLSDETTNPYIPINEDKGNQAEEALSFIKILNILEQDQVSEEDLEVIRSGFYNDGQDLDRQLYEALYHE